MCLVLSQAPVVQVLATVGGMRARRRFLASAKFYSLHNFCGARQLLLNNQHAYKNIFLKYIVDNYFNSTLKGKQVFLYRKLKDITSPKDHYHLNAGFCQSPCPIFKCANLFARLCREAACLSKFGNIFKAFCSLTADSEPVLFCQNITGQTKNNQAFYRLTNVKIVSCYCYLSM